MDERYQAFVAGWQAHAAKVRAEIADFTLGWMENGPSLAAAQAILKRLDAIPVPIPETEAPPVTDAAQ